MRAQPEILPFTPRVLGLTIDHEETLTGPATFIGRRVERPESCPMCPGRPCAAITLGFCVIRAEGYIADESCAGYVLPAPVGRS